jgi:hypothetical protein
MTRGKITHMNSAEKAVQTLRSRKELIVSHDGKSMMWLDIPAFARAAYNGAAGQRFTRPDDTLTEAEFIELWMMQNGRCDLTGIEFSDEKILSDAVVKRPWGASLDRIDSQRGYSRDNVRLVVTIANFARNVFDDSVFDRMCNARTAKLESKRSREPMDGWKEMDFDDVPTVADFKDWTLDQMRQGHTNSDAIREAIRTARKLVRGVATGHPNDTPSDKFVNNHAHALVQLQKSGDIVKVGEKIYRLCN